MEKGTSSIDFGRSVHKKPDEPSGMSLFFETQPAVFDSTMLCLHPGSGARARLNSHSYWLFCAVAPPTAGWIRVTEKKGGNVKWKKKKKLTKTKKYVWGFRELALIFISWGEQKFIVHEFEPVNNYSASSLNCQTPQLVHHSKYCSDSVRRNCWK